MSSITTNPTFPSEGDRQALLLRSKTSTGYDLNKLSTADRWALHAYDYAFRRVYLHDYSGKSPIDQHGDWYNSRLAEDAERVYRPGQRPPPEDPIARIHRELGVSARESQRS